GLPAAHRDGPGPRLPDRPGPRRPQPARSARGTDRHATSRCTTCGAPRRPLRCAESLNYRVHPADGRGTVAGDAATTELGHSPRVVLKEDRRTIRKTTKR